MADYSMEEIKNIVRSIAISGGARGLSVKMLVDDFKKIEGFELPYNRLGFRAADEFLRSLTDTVTITGYGTAAMVQPVVTQNTRHVRELVKNSKSNPRKRFNNNNTYSSPAYRPPEYNSDYRKGNNQSYNRSSTNNGYWKPPQNYVRQTTNDYYDEHRDESRKVKNREFDFVDTAADEDGFGSSDDDMPKFVLTDGKQLAQVQESIQTMTITDSPPKKSTTAKSNDAIPDDAVLALINCLEIPEGAMNLTDTIERQQIAPEIVPRQSVQMFVTEVHNPHRFWYHMGENANKIDELMNEIDDYYSHLERQEWRLTPSSVAVGLYCVAKFSNMWHRAKIVSDLMHNKVKVFYIDYGTVSEVELKEVKFMAKCFSSMPAQAMRASLAYVKPVGHRWTRDASWSLLSLVYEKILYAYVVDVDREENFLDVVLIDTTGNKDNIVNQQMFIKGHAIWEDDVPYKDKSKIIASVRKHFRNFSQALTN
nr:tudor domain-containing protein 5-like isoform X2 [Aedes albopictus]